MTTFRDDLVRRATRPGLLLLAAAFLSGCLSLDLVDRVEAERAQAAEDTPTGSIDVEGADPEETSLLADLRLCEAGQPDCPPVRDVDPGTLLCTARVQLANLQPSIGLQAELAYEGRPLIDGAIPPDDLAQLDGRRVQLAFDLGGLELPDGSYRCEMAVEGGTADTEYVRAEGNREDLWGMRVCARDDTVELGPRVRVCPDDQTELPEGTTAVTCSAAATPSGRAVAFQLDAVPDDQPPVTGISESLGAPALGVVAVHGTIDSAVFGGEPGAPLPNGDYTCRFEVGDGEVVGDHSFRIG